jgi:hypothetical protein
VGAALIGVGVDFAMSAAGAALKRLKEGRNATWVASAATGELTPVAGQAQSFCMTISRGVLMQAEEANLALPGSLAFKGEPVFLLKLNLTLGALPAATGGGATPPATAGSGDGKRKENAPAEAVFLRASPQELRYADTSAPVRGSGRKHVSVIVAFSPQTLLPASGSAAVPDTSKATVLRLDFGRLKTGSIYSAELLGPVTAVANFPKASHTMMTAVISETESADAALEAFLSAFESNKDDLSKAFKKSVQEAVGASTE